MIRRLNLFLGFLEGSESGNIITSQTQDEIIQQKAENECWHISLRFSKEVLRYGLDPKSFINYMGQMGKIEKIKTIGDSYMCAGGIPTKYKDNAIEVLKAALDIRDFMEQYKTKRINQKKPFFEVRIGIHTGQVVAGIVGTRKYAYDIWGDTVNVASRMESSGESGKVNISGDTYKLVKDNPYRYE